MKVNSNKNFGMKKKIDLLLVSLTIMVLSACKEKDPNECNMRGGRDERLIIYNYSPKAFYFQLDYYYPGVNLNDPATGNGDHYAVYPGLSNSFDSRTCWENVFETTIESDTLIVYFFDKHLVDSSWQYVRDNQLYLEQRKLTLNELKQANWEVVYP